MIVILDCFKNDNMSSLLVLCSFSQDLQTKCSEQTKEFSKQSYLITCSFSRAFVFNYWNETNGLHSVLKWKTRWGHYNLSLGLFFSYNSAPTPTLKRDARLKYTMACGLSEYEKELDKQSKEILEKDSCFHTEDS